MDQPSENQLYSKAFFSDSEEDSDTNVSEDQLDDQKNDQLDDQQDDQLNDRLDDQLEDQIEEKKQEQQNDEQQYEQPNHNRRVNPQRPMSYFEWAYTTGGMAEGFTNINGTCYDGRLSR